MIINKNLIEYVKDIKITPEFIKAMLFQLMEENKILREELEEMKNG